MAQSSIVSVESEGANEIDSRKRQIKAEYKSSLQNTPGEPLNFNVVLDFI